MSVDLSAIADRFLTSDFAARLVEAKCQCFAAERRGEDIPLARIAELIDVPPALAEVLMAWNVANARSTAIVEAMAAGRHAAQAEVRH